MSTVLVCDTDTENRSAVTAVLKELGHNVLETANGENCLRALRQNTVDIVIADENIPDRRGAQLVKQVKADHPWVMVIIISTKPAVSAAVECLKVGAINFLVRPVNPESLERAVHEAMLESQMVRQGGPPQVIDTRHRTIAGYEVLDIVGEGTSGTVFRVRRRGEDAVYAMKVLRVMHGTTEEILDCLERFLHEAEAMYRLTHPNIVRVYDYGVTEMEQIAYLVMEFIEGQKLSQVIPRQESFSWSQKALLVRQLADALAAVHRSGITHRDLKPDNIMVLEGLVPKLMDFGIAHTPDSHMTLTADKMGSPAYMAPEAFLSARVDCRADLFSLGVVAYELFVGQRPFPANTIAHVAHQVLYSKPPSPYRFRSDFPPVLEGILARLLQKEPDRRYQSTADVVNDLGPVVENLIAVESTGDLRKVKGFRLASRLASPVADQSVWEDA